MGAILREQNALPYGYLNICYSLAKDDVDNVGAGRAAKGANHFAPLQIQRSVSPPRPSGGRARRREWKAGKRR